MTVDFYCFVGFFMLKLSSFIRISTQFVRKKWYFNALFLQLIEKGVNLLPTVT